MRLEQNQRASPARDEGPSRPAEQAQALSASHADAPPLVGGTPAPPIVQADNAPPVTPMAAAGIAVRTDLADHFSAESAPGTNSESPFDSRRPEPLARPPSGRGADLYCEYHRGYGHLTDQCRSLKMEIAEMLRRGIIGKDVVDGKPKNREPEEDREHEGKGAVLVLAGGPAGGGDSSRKRKAYASAVILGIRGRSGTLRIRGRSSTPKIRGRSGTPRIRGRFGTLRIRGRYGTLRIRGRFGTLRIRGRCDTLGIRGRFGTLKIRGRFDTLRIRGRYDTLRIRGRFGTLKI
ncbi:hypothetical protein Taro_011978 [Colocasia esculenta]|uniref:Uncharacterized protein n=1 Tax=Colocasia esculenta TaxID=4460 RepID=A0A843U2V0_COLES|nr:hypothetical protein [Colocasia esculenta]